MKKLGLIMALLVTFNWAKAQYNNTNYGSGAGNSGNDNSFFGYKAGDITTGTDNTGIGSSALEKNTTGRDNVAVGAFSLQYNTSGRYNVSLGNSALNNNTTGRNNTAFGDRALFENTTGATNTAIGTAAMFNNTTGSINIAIGQSALSSNTIGENNIAIGYLSLANTQTTNNNTAVGHYSMLNTTTGGYNVALGDRAMLSNTTGADNTSIGYQNLLNNITGNKNTAIGREALLNSTSSYNTATGYRAAYKTTTGRYNTANGYQAAYDNTTGSYNAAIGYRSMISSSTGNYNTAVGYFTGIYGDYDYSTALGAYAACTASNQVRIGGGGVNSIGGFQNWTNLSDGRFKKEVKEDVIGLDFIKALRPVSYYVDHQALNKFLKVELDENTQAMIAAQGKTYQTGFIAQEVEATAQKLGFEQFHGVDVPQNENDHYGLRYAEFVVPLVKSVQELSEQNETLKELLAQQQVQINDLLESKQTTLNTTTISIESQAKLHQNTPNPFTNETQIKLFVPTEVGQALIQVCTIDGKQLFVKEVAGRDETSITISADNLPAGIYMYTLIVDNEVIASKRMVLTK